MHSFGGVFSGQASSLMVNMAWVCARVAAAKQTIAFGRSPRGQASPSLLHTRFLGRLQKHNNTAGALHEQ